MSLKHNEQLIAYLATLAALVVVFLAALIGASIGNLTSLEALGVGTVTGGLIGALRMPGARTVTIDNPPSDPVPVEPKPDDPEIRP